VVKGIELKIRAPDSEKKFFGLFGHDTNIQNFYKVFMNEEEIYSNKHRIPAFAATLSWELYQVAKPQNYLGRPQFELEIRVDGDPLDLKACPKGRCPVGPFLEFSKGFLKGPSYEQFCAGESLILGPNRDEMAYDL